MERSDLITKFKDVLAEALYKLSELGSQVRKPPTYLEGYVTVPTELRVSESVGYCQAQVIYYPLEGILIVEAEGGESKFRWGGFLSSYPVLLQQKIGTPYEVAALVKVIRRLSDHLRGVLKAAWEGFTLDYKMVESVIHEEEK